MKRKLTKKFDHGLISVTIVGPSVFKTEIDRYISETNRTMASFIEELNKLGKGYNEHSKNDSSEGVVEHSAIGFDVSWAMIISRQVPSKKIVETMLKHVSEVQRLCQINLN